MIENICNINIQHKNTMISRYSRPEMASLWTEEAKLKLWLEVETLALEGMVKIGLAPQSALDSVRKKGNFNVDRVLEIEKEVKHDVIAFLTNVAEYVGEDARYLHMGMTSSDLLDTCFSLQLCQATDLIIKGLEDLLAVIKSQALKYKDTVCIGRSHGIHAEPITFGLKLASLYAELKRHLARVKFAREEMATGAISGPVGTYAHLSPEVEKFVCEKLGFKPTPVSTQVISRDIHASLFSSFAQLASSLERIVVEIRHLQRTEVREAEENFTKGQKGSSAMPHKRNPILSENVTGLCRMIRKWAEATLENVALWHERDISHSSVERFVAPDITITLDFALARVTSIIKDLQVYPENMKRNLELTKGLIYSGTLLPLMAAKGMKREDAYALIQKHAMATWDEINQGIDGPSFEKRIKEDSNVMSMFTKEEIAEVFSLKHHLKNVDFIFRRTFE